MRSARFSITLLLLVILPIVDVVASQSLNLAAGQSATTITMTLTTTSTWSLSGPFSIPGLENTPACGWRITNLNATKGQHFSVSLTSSTPISFYVMSDSVYRNWTFQGSSVRHGVITPCHDGAPAGALLSKTEIASYTGNLDFPADGRYWIFFLNLDSPTPVQVDFELYSSPVVVTSTTVVVSQLSAQFTIIGLGAIIVVALALVLFFARRKAATAVVAEETKGDSGRDVTKKPGTKSCPVCKSILPESAQFCDECGNSLETNVALTGTTPEPGGTPSHDTLFCTNCSGKIPAGVKFCPYCAAEQPRLP